MEVCLAMSSIRLGRDDLPLSSSMQLLEFNFQKRGMHFLFLWQVLMYEFRLCLKILWASMDLVATYAAEFEARFGGTDPEEIAAALGYKLQSYTPSIDVAEEIPIPLQTKSSVHESNWQTISSPIGSSKHEQSSPVCINDCKKACNCLSPNTACRRIMSARRKMQRKRKAEKEALIQCEDKERVGIRYKQSLCKQIVDYINKVCSNLHPDDRREVVSRAAEKLPEFDMIGFKEFNVYRHVFDNVKNSLESKKRCRTQDVNQARASTMMMAVNHCTNRAAVARALNLKRKAVYVAIDKRKRAEFGGPWSMFKKKARMDKLCDEDREKVYDFWVSETRVSPNKRQVLKLRRQNNGEILLKPHLLHAIHFLEESQVMFYKRFKRQYPSMKIGLRLFEALKPKFVRRLKERETCCCIYHMRAEFVRQALSKMRRDSKLHGSNCTCKCDVCGYGPTCEASKHTFMSVSEMWRSMVCPKKDTTTWYKGTCLQLECSACGLKCFKKCPKERSKRVKMDWKNFEKVKETYAKDVGKGGKPVVKTKDVMKLVYKNTSCSDFLQHADAVFKQFIPHNYTARWQAEQFKECLQTFPADVVISVIDFAENYSFKIQQEIQTLHWRNDQCSILVHITYRHARRDESSNIQIGDRKLVKETHFYMSDDREHDTDFVQHCLQKHADYLVAKGINYSLHVFWSDGCAAQFKSSRSFYYLGRFYERTGIKMEWNFFASSHGKGEHDGAGAVIKRILTSEMLKRSSTPLRNAEDAVNFLKWYFTIKRGMKDSNIIRQFWLIRVGEVCRKIRYDCGTLKGTTRITIWQFITLFHLTKSHAYALCHIRLKSHAYAEIMAFRTVESGIFIVSKYSGCPTPN